MAAKVGPDFDWDWAKVGGQYFDWEWAKVGPDFNWECMLKWWNAHSDGSHSPVSGNDQERIMEDDEDQEPFICNVITRVHQIGLLFHVDDGPSITVAEFVDSLDELQELIKYVDVTKELDRVGGLAPLFFNVLDFKNDAGVHNKHACIRAKAAEVITTMVQNHPTCQQLVMNVDGLQPLLYNLTKDPDVTARTKALGAISSLIRSNERGQTSFHQRNGYRALKHALRSVNLVEFQREALNLIQYLLHENSSDSYIVTRLGFPRIMMHLTSSDDAQVREAALRGLLVLARDESGNSRRLVKNDYKLKQVLQEQIKRICAMAPEDLVAAMEERQLVDSLWNACYNEPSALGRKGILVLPGCELPEHQELAGSYMP